MYCILIAGVPASGKTTFGRYLSKEIGVPMISKDDIKEKLFDTIGFKCREDKLKLGSAATEAMYCCAEASMQANLPIIIENNFENSSKPGLEAILKKYQYTPITVRFEGDLEVIYDRFVQRDQSPYRHRGHITNTCYPEIPGQEAVYVPMGSEVFVKRYTERGMKDFSMGEPLISVDCTDLSRIDYDKIVAEVKAAIASLPEEQR